MGSHSSILAWKLPWTEEPGGLYSPWGRKESDTTERLRVHTQQRREEMMVLWARVLSIETSLSLCLFDHLFHFLKMRDNQACV